jgi:dethiobiotin synthetase
MNKGVFIAGTGTDVGKTYIGSALCASLYQKNVAIAPFKPIESDCLMTANKLYAKDAMMYFDAVDKTISDNIITPFRFKQTCSTARAATINHQKIILSDILNHINEHNNHNSILIVEGAGGMLSPFCYDGLTIDLAKKLSLPIILVASNKIGVINDVLLNLDLFTKHNLKCEYIILNNIDNNNSGDMDNVVELQQYTNIKIIYNDYNSHHFVKYIKIQL